MQPGAPGDKAGFRVGDILYRFDGQPVPLLNPIAALREKVIPLKLRVVSTRTVGILRDGVELELPVTWPPWSWQENADELRDLPDLQLDRPV